MLFLTWEYSLAFFLFSQQPEFIFNMINLKLEMNENEVPEHHRQLLSGPSNL